MKVLKFGGTSMGDADSWQQIAHIAEGSQPCILVVSATSGTTDQLIDSARLAEQGEITRAMEGADSIKKRHESLISEFAGKYSADSRVYQDKTQQQIDELDQELRNYLNGIYMLEELTHKTLDAVSSIGERLSSFLLAECCRMHGLAAVFVDSGDIITTDRTFGKAVPDRERLRRQSESLLHELKNQRMPIMGGFYGRTPEGKIATLGRGGSDFSASLVAEAVSAESLEVWTDVSGMYTCDPRVVPEAETLPELNYHEAAELAYFGAKILHPATIQPAVDADIPVHIKNTFAPNEYGTVITSEIDPEKNIKAIAFKRDITLITITSSRMLMAYGFLARVFAVFEELQISVDLVTTSEVSVTMSIDNTDRFNELCEELETYGRVSVERHQALLCLVGNNFLQSKGIANRVFSALADIPVRMISQGSSDMNLSLVIANESVEDGARALHREFFSK